MQGEGSYALSLIFIVVIFFGYVSYRCCGIFTVLIFGEEVLRQIVN